MLSNTKKSAGDGKHDSIIGNVTFITEFRKDFSKIFNYRCLHTTQQRNMKMQSKNMYLQSQSKLNLKTGDVNKSVGRLCQFLKQWNLSLKTSSFLSVYKAIKYLFSKLHMKIKFQKITG